MFGKRRHLALLFITLRRLRKDMMQASDAAEQIENAEATDPIEATDRAEPIEPTERAEPIEPIASTEPREPMHSSESCDHRDHFEVCRPLRAPTPPAYYRLVALPP
ncbi:MAG TPA: hypothetical protein VG186_06890 [Solirubrobacteraceae bacterium]|nr:hypothetical protein [Solirubrobacteraceae bacterium]